MSFEPKIFQSDDGSPYDGLPRPSHDRAPLAQPAAPLWNDADELELPADLAMLAEQLRDDALYLAQRHPADATPEQRAAAWLELETSAVKQGGGAKSRSARVHRWVSGVAAAAVVVGAGWLGWQLNQRQDDRRENVVVATSPSSSANDGEPAIESPPAVAAIDSERSVIAVSDEPSGPRILRLPDNSPPRVITAGGFLQDVSGPELDAMLELLAEQTDTGLSI